MSVRVAPNWSSAWLIVLGSAVGYFLTARLGLLLALPPDHKVGPVWPAAGVALAAALLAGRRALSGVWVGAFSANLADALRPDIPVSFGTHLLVSAGIATGSTLQAAAGAVLLRRWAGGVGAFGRAGGVFRFVAVVPAACLIAATVGTGWVCGGGLAPWPAAAGVWATWWLGDAVGMLLAVPLVVAWARPRGADEPARTAEAAALVVALGVVSAGVFGGPPGLGMAAGPLAYLTVPGLVWAAVRLGRRGAATGLALVAAAAVGATVAGAGPFVRADARESLLQLDVFLAVVAGTTLVMAAVMAERGAAEDDLRDSQAELRELNAALERRVADRAAELARSEAARRDTEDRFRAFTDHSPAVSFMKDEGGRMVFVSRACANRFRIDPADWLGKTDAELWPPALAEQLRANDRAVLDSGRPLDVVEEVADPDGTVHTWRSLKFSFRDAAGRRYVGGTAVDITDQRRAEAALRASEEEFRRLVDDSPIGIYRTTPDGRVLMANPAAVRLAGCGSFAELAAHNLEERGSHAGYDRAEFKRRLEADGEVLGLESVWRRPGKHPVYVRENARVVRGPGGGVLYYEGTAEDITDRRRAEETLRVLFECSSDAHLLFDPDWGIFDANPAAAAMLGFADKAELVGRHPAEFSPDYQPDGRLSLEKCVEMDGLARANGHHRFDWQHRRADGTDFPCEVTLTPVEIGGRTALLAVWHDLTDRKKAEDALRQSEEQFRLSFDQAAIGKALVAPDGRWLRVNRAVCEIVGYTEAELLARTFQDITHPDDLAADLDLVRRVLGGDLRTYQIEKRYVHKDGRAVWVLLSVSLVRDAAGDPVHFVSQIQDVTARKRAEDALRASEDRFRRAFDSSGIGMALAAADGRLLRVNPALGRLLGYDPGELVGATFQALTHPDDLAANLDLHADALAGRRDSYRLEKRYVHKDGHPVWAELTVAVMAAPGADGAVLVGQVQDVTARREAEARARKARADLLDAIEGLDAGLVVYGPDERLVVCNSRHRELYAAHADALRPGCRYEDVLRSYYRAGGAVQPPGVDEETWVAGRLRAHRNPGPAREWLHEGRWLLITDRPTRDGGVVSLRTDITALKLAQETAEAASKAKSEFLANMSHEIRTPMNAILGMTDLVLDTPLAPDQREFLRLARESGASLLRIINDILDFSKVEAGRLELEAAPFRLRDAVCRAVEPLAVRAAQKGLGLTCRVAPGVPDRVVGDAGRLGQVLVNLVGNAVKFTPRGEVVLSVGCGGLDGDEAELRFAVSDTGIGVPPEHRAAIFEAFVQADASLTRRFGGTGLGLAISAKLVGLMGGRIWVDSEEGQGSTFHFTVRLPVAAGADGPSRDGLVWVATAPGAARPVVPAGSGSGETPLPAAARPLRVLVAEDNPVNQKLVERMLANRGHRAVLVGDGREALDRLRVERFDAVLMDVQMPVLDGLAATAALRDLERAAGRHTPVIALTAHALAGDRERCLAAGCDEYLSKPVRKDDLYPLLEAVAEGAGAPAPSADVAADTPAPVGRVVFDRAAALARVNGDGAFLAELVEMFLDRWPQQRGLLREAVAAGDAVSARRQAHTLKGTLAALGADAAVAAAGAVDRAARAALPRGAEELVDALEAEVARFAEVAAGAGTVS